MAVTSVIKTISAGQIISFLLWGFIKEGTSLGTPRSATMKRMQATEAGEEAGVWPGAGEEAGVGV